MKNRNLKASHSGRSTSSISLCFTFFYFFFRFLSGNQRIFVLLSCQFVRSISLRTQIHCFDKRIRILNKQIIGVRNRCYSYSQLIERLSVVFNELCFCFEIISQLIPLQLQGPELGNLIAITAGRFCHLLIHLCLGFRHCHGGLSPLEQIPDPADNTLPIYREQGNADRYKAVPAEQSGSQLFKDRHTLLAFLHGLFVGSSKFINFVGKHRDIVRDGEEKHIRSHCGRRQLADDLRHRYIQPVECRLVITHIRTEIPQPLFGRTDLRLHLGYSLRYPIAYGTLSIGGRQCIVFRRKVTNGCT